MKKVFLAIIAVMIIIATAFFFYVRSIIKVPKKWVTEKVTIGNIISYVSASGSLAALKTVIVGSQVSGNIQKLFADFNDKVKAGQIVAQIDPSTFIAQVQQAKANLASAQASKKNIEAQIKNLNSSLVTADAEINISKANKTKAQVNVEDALRNFKRISALYKKKLVSVSDRDSALTKLDLAKASLESANAQIQASKAKKNAIYAQIDAAKAQLEGANSKIKQMQALLNIAQINLERTKIISPVDGVVISRKVDVGQTVAASLQAPQLFTIAQDLRKMQIDTAVDEADIGNVKEGQKVTFTVDAYRNKVFEGIIEQVRLMPFENSNVVTYSVMVNVKNDDLLLKPGMTANVEILADNKKNVLRIPVKAMYFKMPGKKHEDKEIQNRAADELPIWILQKGKPVKKIVKIGIYNENYIEVLSDNIKEGDLIITGQQKFKHDKKKKNKVSLSIGK